MEEQELFEMSQEQQVTPGQKLNSDFPNPKHPPEMFWLWLNPCQELLSGPACDFWSWETAEEIDQGWSRSWWIAGSLQGLRDATSGRGWGRAWSCNHCECGLVCCRFGMDNCAWAQGWGEQKVAPCQRYPGVWSVQLKEVCQAKR